MGKLVFGSRQTKQDRVPGRRATIEPVPSSTSAAKKFLYISPFFPPLSRAGALDPLKMVRGLMAHGWEAVVLADIWPGAPVDADHLNAVPPEVIVHRAFSGRTYSPETEARAHTSGELSRFAKRVTDAVLPQQLLPMGEMGAFIAHASDKAAALIQRYGCRAVVAHSTPVAALAAGHAAAMQSGLPLISVLGDPWGPCDLWRARRPLHTRIIEERRERAVMRASFRTVLYTEQARDDYVRFYRDVPSHRFVSVHNGPDPAIFTESWPGSFARPTLLFFGGFSTQIKPTAIVHLLAELARRGGLAGQTGCATTTAFPAEDCRLAERMGVADRIAVIDRASYRQALSVMAASDILVAINVTPQRIPSKFYDYLASDRPVLVISPPHPQIDNILRSSGAGRRIAPDDAAAMADFVEHCLENGRYPQRRRDPRIMETYCFDATARTIAEFLNLATGERDVEQHYAPRAMAEA